MRLQQENLVTRTICFANVGCSPTPRQHFWKTAAPKNFLVACGSNFPPNHKKGQRIILVAPFFLNSCSYMHHFICMFRKFSSIQLLNIVHQIICTPVNLPINRRIKSNLYFSICLFQNQPQIGWQPCAPAFLDQQNVTPNDKRQLGFPLKSLRFIRK